MAIDTASKRGSIIVGTLPFPDGTIAAGDRQHTVNMYSGIAAGLPTEEEEVSTSQRRRVGPAHLVTIRR